MKTDLIYGEGKNIFKCKYFSLDIWHVNANSVDKKHYHDNFEVVYVMKGGCKTHKQGRFYIYKRGQIHDVINDSKKELMVMCLTVPPESEENTHYV